MLQREGVPLLDDDPVDLTLCHCIPGTVEVEGRPTGVDWATEMGDWA